MCIASVTSDYDNITLDNYTNTLNDYDNCTNNEKNVAKITPSLLLTVPCGL